MTVVTGQRGALGLAALLTTTGILHFLLPRPFVTIVPRALPHKEALVAASGVAELVCAGLLVAPGTRRAGGAASATVLLAVFPANASMALRSTRRSRRYRGGMGAVAPAGAADLVGSADRTSPTAALKGRGVRVTVAQPLRLALPRRSGRPPGHR
ncbi:MAG TPA: hypothetical protein VFC16_10295 [Nakamurella sp.]|nr:hypothetical protein [Nakamurella sp.]